jgi:hypothetical protein
MQDDGAIVRLVSFGLKNNSRPFLPRQFLKMASKAVVKGAVVRPKWAVRRQANDRQPIEWVRHGAGSLFDTEFYAVALCRHLTKFGCCFPR